MFNVVAICGSTRAASSNPNVIHTIAELARDRFTVQLHNGLEPLPQFNRDRDNADVPAEVADLRKQLRAAGGVLICTPEYAIGVPGALKNAIDPSVRLRRFQGPSRTLAERKAHARVYRPVNKKPRFRGVFVLTD